MCGIYKIENLINGKKYIGQSVDIQYRFSNHKSESFNPKSNAYNTAIHRAIRKYGLENFSFEVIEECEQEVLKEREKYWISYYQSFGAGYNMTSGGEGVQTVNIKFVCQLWDDGLSIEEIAMTVPCGKHTAIHILESYAQYNRQESCRRGRKNASKKMSKPVAQYDKQGNFINKYGSITEASKQTNIRSSDISAVLSGRQLSAGGFQWIYDGEKAPCIYNAKSSCDKKPVLQYDLDGNLINEYSCMSEAIKAVGLLSVASIARSCASSSHTAAGYKWEWKN